jgi:SAM-dependent methyltransferase
VVVIGGFVSLQKPLLASIRRMVSLRPFRKAWPVAPIDRQYGISTSSRERTWQLHTGDAEVDGANVGYVGSQPSVVRRALETIGATETATFVDLGCGKGRTLAVASEYPFRAVIGIEIARRLVRIARQNAKLIAQDHPRRPAIDVRLGDATDLSGLDGGDLVLFLYNRFRRPLVTRLIASIEQWAKRNPSARLHLVYYNCVHFDLFDNAQSLERFSVQQMPFTEEECATSPFDNTSEAVAIYRLRGRDTGAVLADAGRSIRVTIADYGAEISSD